MSYATTILRDNPTAYYRLNELSGTSATDSSGNNNTGILSGSGITYGIKGALIGDSSTAFTLSGNNGYLASNLASGGLTAISVELWCKPTTLPLTTSSRVFADAHTDASNTGIQFLMNTDGGGGALYIGNGSGNGNAYFTFTFSTTVYTHIVCSYDGAHMYVYCNGSQVGASSYTGSISASGYAINFGRNPAYNGDYFTGNIDEPAIYQSIALTSTQVLAHYNAGITSGISIIGKQHTFARLQ